MSELAEMADNYLALRRSLGYKLDEAGRLLPRFVAYLDAIGAETVTIENALEWSQQPNASSTSTVWEHRTDFPHERMGFYVPHPSARSTRRSSASSSSTRSSASRCPRSISGV